MVRLRRHRIHEHDALAPHDVEEIHHHEETYVERPVDRPVSEHEVESHRLVERPPFSPAQIVALVFGVLSLAVGGIVLATAGLSGLTTHVEFLGFHHTPILGLIEVVFGVLLLGSATPFAPERGSMTFLAALAIGAGIIFVAAPAAFHDLLGVHEATGWLFIFVGAVILFTALVSPVVMGRERIMHYRR